MKTRGKSKSRKTKRKPVARKTSSSTEDSAEDPPAKLLVPELKSPRAVKSPGVKSPGLASPRQGPSRANSKTVEDFVQQVILEAIEGKIGGGIEAVLEREQGYCKLLDALAEAGHHEVVGESDSKLRKKLKDRVRYYTKLPREQYKDLLEHFKVIPYKYRGTSDEDYSVPAKEPSQRAKKATLKPPPRVEFTKFRDGDADGSVLTEDESE